MGIYIFSALVISTLNSRAQVQQHEFRENFRTTAPFKFSSPDCYGSLDKCHVDISHMEAEMKKIYDSASIFEINPPDFKQMKQCRREVRAEIKQLKNARA